MCSRSSVADPRWITTLSSGRRDSWSNMACFTSVRFFMDSLLPFEGGGGSWCFWGPGNFGGFWPGNCRRGKIEVLEWDQPRNGDSQVSAILVPALTIQGTIVFVKQGAFTGWAWVFHRGTFYVDNCRTISNRPLGGVCRPPSL